MKSKRLLQLFVLLVMLFSPLGSVQQASASTGPAPALDAVVIDRNLNYWDATYYGFVSSGIYENWRFEFTGSHHFVVTVTRMSGDLTPVIILLDGAGSELARGTGSLTSTQPSGSYSFQVQPESGMGLYMLTLREVSAPILPSASTVVAPTEINVGETAAVTVSLNNIPAEGYTSAEFTCSYNENLLEVGNISVTGLFGTDPVMAVKQQSGSFIVAIAGSNGRKATTGGTAFTFGVEALQAGQTAIECTARISKGDNVLTGLPSSPANLIVQGGPPTDTPTFTPTLTPTPVTDTPTFTPTPITDTPTFTPTPVTDTPTFTPTPITDTPTPITDTPTFTPTPITDTPTFTPTPVTDTPTPITDTPTFTPTPITDTPTFTPTPLPTNGTLTGQVLAGKPVTVTLHNPDTSEAALVVANEDGTFSLSAPAGTYTVRAVASGFLMAQGSVTLTAGGTSTKPAVTLLAGDVDGNNVIDQFDAMTLGMSYNTATPDQADLNDDGIINVLDLELLARNYRQTGPIVW